MGRKWLSRLEKLVEKTPLVVLQFEGDELSRLRESRYGMKEFTIARPHQSLSRVRPLSVCVIFGIDALEAETRIGIVSSISAVSTLESRVKVRYAQSIEPSSKADFLQFVTEQPHATNLQSRLASENSVIMLSSKLSVHLVRKLAELELNRGSMRTLAAWLSSPKRFRNMWVVQQDAVQTALRAFGLSPQYEAASLSLVRGHDTALERINVVEDAVIEHDARSVPGYDLVGSDLTGHAVFERGIEKLEIYTANRRPLEQVFGVDLIYLNSTRQNIVMVQYKMLEPERRATGGVDWVYRPESNLESEIKRMRAFSIDSSPNSHEYRLNPQVYYLKFVKRDGALKNAAITIPIDHFHRLRADSAFKGPRGGVRISFNDLGGRYLRQGAFLDLIRSGYIGAQAETTTNLKELMQAVLRGDKTVVAAVQAKMDTVDNDPVQSGSMEDSIDAP